MYVHYQSGSRNLYSSWKRQQTILTLVDGIVWKVIPVIYKLILKSELDIFKWLQFIITFTYSINTNIILTNVNAN